MSLPYLAAPALRAAFLRVKENHGCAGADGEALAAFEAFLDARLCDLEKRVEDQSYWAWPLRRIEVEKHPGDSERRTLLVPSVADRVLQTAVAAFLEPLVEPELDDCSFAYRRGRSVRMAVERVYLLYNQGYTWLLDADIDDCFASFDREMVAGRLATLVRDETALRLVRLWLDYAVWDGAHLTRPALGLPQGAVVSPMLANLCLDAMDDRLLAEGLKLVRYADDFVILCKGRKAAERAYELAEESLAALRLKLDAGKTRITRFSEGFRFLGVIFLKDMLLQPFKTGRQRLKVLSVAEPMPAAPPACERRPLRQYRGF
jgi:group II intron reverse transcriptase/maturase